MDKQAKLEIIKKTKEFVINDSGIKKYNFFPWIILTLFFTLTLFYQIVYTYTVVLGKQYIVLNYILELLESNFMKFLIIPIILFFVCYVLICPIYEAGLIWYVSKKYTPDESDDLTRMDALSNGLYKFLPFFEFSNLFNQFKFVNLLNSFLFAIRFIWIKYIWYLSIVFLFLLFLFLIINVLLVYSKFELTLNNKKTYWAISSSVRMSIINLWDTIWFYFHMIFMNLKASINFLIFLFFPVIISSAFLFIWPQFLKVIAIIILGILFVLLMMFLWYSYWVLWVYKTMLWYHIYEESKRKLKQA